MTRKEMIDKLEAVPADVLENNYVTTFESNGTVTCQGGYNSEIVLKYRQFEPKVELDTGYVLFWISETCRIVLT